MAKNYEREEFTALKCKLEKLLAEWGFLLQFNGDVYPIEFVILPDQSVGGQLTMMEVGDDTLPAIDSRLRLIFRNGGIVVASSSRITLPDALLSKIKILAKKAHYLYLQAYFRDHREADLDELDDEADGGDL